MWSILQTVTNTKWCDEVDEQLAHYLRTREKGASVFSSVKSLPWVYTRSWSSQPVTWLSNKSQQWSQLPSQQDVLLDQPVKRNDDGGQLTTQLSSIYFDIPLVSQIGVFFFSFTKPVAEQWRDATGHHRHSLLREKTRDNSCVHSSNLHTQRSPKHEKNHSNKEWSRIVIIFIFSFTYFCFGLGLSIHKFAKRFFFFLLRDHIFCERNH